MSVKYVSRWRLFWWEVLGRWYVFRGRCFYCGQNPCSLDTAEGKAAADAMFGVQSWQAEREE